MESWLFYGSGGRWAGAASPKLVDAPGERAGTMTGDALAWVVKIAIEIEDVPGSTGVTHFAVVLGDVRRQSFAWCGGMGEEAALAQPTPADGSLRPDCRRRPSPARRAAAPGCGKGIAVYSKSPRRPQTIETIPTWHPVAVCSSTAGPLCPDVNFVAP